MMVKRVLMEAITMAMAMLIITGQGSTEGKVGQKHLMFGQNLRSCESDCRGGEPSAACGILTGETKQRALAGGGIAGRDGDAEAKREEGLHTFHQQSWHAHH